MAAAVTRTGTTLADLLDEETPGTRWAGDTGLAAARQVASSGTGPEAEEAGVSKAGGVAGLPA
jgi:hypothetical protein